MFPAIEKSDLHTVQYANCGSFVEERSTGYLHFCTLGENIDGTLLLVVFGCLFTSFSQQALHHHLFRGADIPVSWSLLPSRQKCCQLEIPSSERY